MIKAFILLAVAFQCCLTVIVQDTDDVRSALQQRSDAASSTEVLWQPGQIHLSWTDDPTEMMVTWVSRDK